MIGTPAHLTIDVAPGCGACGLACCKIAPSIEDWLGVDHLRSEAGSWYRVIDSRQVRSKIHPRRIRFEVERLGRSEPEGMTDVDWAKKVLHFHWHDRG